MSEDRQQNQSAGFDSVLDRYWDEIDLLDQQIANLEAELAEAKVTDEIDLLAKQLAELKAKREEKSEYLKGFY